MRYFSRIRIPITGLAAGLMNGLLGTGGGIVLVPSLSKSNKIKENHIFPASVALIFPLCAASLLLEAPAEIFSSPTPYLYGLGGCAGGIAAGRFPLKTGMLRMILGVLLIAGGLRGLWILIH